MSFGSINNLLILSTFETELASLSDNVMYEKGLFPKTILALKEEFPNINDDDIIKILSLLFDMHKRCSNEKVELVVTAPPSFEIKTSLTEDIIFKILNSAKQSIIITGYSISEYIDEFIDLIVKKSQNGVFVKIYFNNIKSQDSIEKIIRYKGRFLEVYDYHNEADNMSALHAKVISIDGKISLISSANLSYHGMSGNIELGCLIESKDIASKIDDTLKQLTIQKVLKKIND